MPFAGVDQRRSANARRIQRMGGVTAEDTQRVEVVMPDSDANEPEVLTDMIGTPVRRL